MTDQIEELFADLRAETLPTVRPPGTEPLRKAVRRRRAAVSSTAAVAVLALAGLLAVVRPGGNAEPVTTPSSAPPPQHLTPTGLAQEVGESLDVIPEEPGLGQIFKDTAKGPLRSERELLGGTYELRLSCYGSGSMGVSATTGGVGATPRVTVADVACEAVNQHQSVSVVVPEPTGRLTLDVVPDVAGPGQAAFGWNARLEQSDESRWQQAAKDALGEQTSGFAGGGSQFVSDGGTGFQHEDIEPGRYRIRAVCLGFGTIRLSVGPAAAADSASFADDATARCSPGAPQSASVTYTASSKGLYYEVDPDAGAQHRSAVATVMERY